MNKTTLLAILQQSEYDLPRWRTWVAQHQGETKTVQPADWTPKLKLIDHLSSGLFFLPLATAISWAVRLTQPAEQVIRWGYYFSASWKLWRYKAKGLTVVAIAGSYAKTSTKHILAHTLGGSHQVLMTPKSVNTLLGIAQVIRQDLQSSHTLLIVELGEYRRHDIAKLCRFIRPDYGILTPIGPQHLEILGSFENVVTELRDLLSYFKDKPNRSLVSDRNRQYFSNQRLTYYGHQSTSTYQVAAVTVSRAGTEYQVQLPSRGDQPTQLELFSPLFGEHQAINSLTSFWLADQLGLNRLDIKKRLSTVPYIHRRHEPTFADNDVLILDNSYNTNQDSFKESLKLLNQLKPQNRILITLGFTELGDEAMNVHYRLGESLAGQVDYLGLIKAPWTDEIIRGFMASGGHKNQVVVGKDQAEAFDRLQHKVSPGSVILFEGGYQEVYI